MKIDGGCHCGHIAYQAEIDPGKVLVCHCTDCQTISGTAFRTVVFAAEDSFKLLAGALKTYVKTAESGALRAQTFCPECGTHIYATSVGATSVGDRPKTFGVRVGTTRQRGELRPTAQYWCRSALDWVANLGSLKRVE